MSLELFRLDHQVAMVTGAHQGLGQAIAVGLAEAGADIVALDRSEPTETGDAVEALGRRFIWRRVDLGVESVAELAAVVDETVEQMGRLDILVNNAGTIRRAPAVEYSEADWDAVMQVNLKSLFFLTQAVGRHMLHQGHGKIIHVASVLSFQGGILVPSYTAAKHGVAGLTRALANEWAAQGVNVNAIAPGYVETSNTAALRADAERKPAITARIPAGRWAVPADLVGAAVFLASRASDYVHGTVLRVDGGWLGR
ncbi:MAG: 2-dehydro-3-deoxy-D-gluconate 5-dehydrogenase KduD [Anaerolineae bacterium]|nr:2-dehydro-3-deoxy-D-gluconate 5-dehydrogenase KduD [Anaerolineae bacterium]